MRHNTLGQSLNAKRTTAVAAHSIVMLMAITIVGLCSCGLRADAGKN